MIASPAELKYFIEVARTENISRAAERLGLSQPSLTIALKRLEHTVGTPLFIRSKKGVTLTKNGQYLLSQSQFLLDSWHNIKIKTKNYAETIEGHYKIGYSATHAKHCLAEMMPAFVAKHPFLDLSFVSGLSRHIGADVIAHKIDLAIVVNPVKHPDLVIKPICQDYFSLWQSPNLKAENKNILIYNPDFKSSDLMLKALKKKKKEFDRYISVSESSLISELTAHGAGIGLLPAQVIKHAAIDVVEYPSSPRLYDQHAIIYRIENKKIAFINESVKHIQHFYQKSI